MHPTEWWGYEYWGDFMWFFPLFFTVVLLFGMRGLFGKDSPGGGSQGDDTPYLGSAREILDKRFAKGEITMEEYEEMKKARGNETS